MDLQLSKIRKYYPSLLMTDLKKIDAARCERLKLLMCNNILENIRWLIEEKVRLAGKNSPSFKHFLDLGKSSLAKKQRAKRVNGCHKCARWTCNTMQIKGQLLSLEDISNEIGSIIKWSPTQ